jgi:hypothetical protein
MVDRRWHVLLLSTSDYHFLVIAVAANLIALGSVSSCRLIVVWNPQYGCTGDLPRNPDVRSNGVDSFDSMLLDIRATTDP